MPTVIRLKRGGRSHDPYYRVIVSDSRNRATGRVIEEIGVYHPCARPEPKTEIQEDKALSWLAKGAVPSETVRNEFRKLGIMAKHDQARKASTKAAKAKKV